MRAAAAAASLLLLLSCLSAPPARGCQTTPPMPVTPAAYVADLLQSVSTHQSGFAPYEARPATMENLFYPRALVTHVLSGPRAADAASTLTLRLDGRYALFQATVGRDDADAPNGPAPCVFEVWGDNKRLWQSAAIRSSQRRAPQFLEVPVVGVITLQLVTRYAGNNTSRDVFRARGCVWADARLLAPAGEAAALPPSPASRSPVRAGEEDPLRQTLRLAVLRLAAALPVTSAGPQETPVVGVAPLSIASDAPRPWRDENKLKAMIAEQLACVRRGANAVFHSLGPAASERLARDLKLPRRREPWTPREIAAKGRSVGADLVLVGQIVRRDGWTLDLQMVEVESEGATQHLSAPLAGDL